MERSKMKNLVLATLLLMSCITAKATCPLFDRIEYEGKSLVVPKPTDFPRSKEYKAWFEAIDQSRCSAVNQGRPRYVVEDGLIYLVDFYGCGTKLDAAEAYSGSSSKVLAVWLTGDYEAYSPLGYCPFLDQESLVQVFSIIKGKIVDIKSRARF